MPAAHPSTIPIRATSHLIQAKRPTKEIPQRSAIANSRSLCIMTSLDELPGAVEQQKERLDHGCRIWRTTRHINIHGQDALDAVAAAVSAAVAPPETAHVPMAITHRGSGMAL